MKQNILTGKKIGIIIAFKDFRDEEYFVPKEVLEAAGAEVKTVSNQTGEAIGADGGETEIDLLLENLISSDFDGIVFIGGSGALKHLDNEISYRIAQEITEQRKVLAAICIAPVILAKAGVLSGKKATVWSSPLDKSSITTLKDNGTIYQDDDVVIDGKIITANGPASAKKFGQAIIGLLK